MISLFLALNNSPIEESFLKYSSFRCTITSNGIRVLGRLVRSYSRQDISDLRAEGFSGGDYLSVTVRSKSIRVYEALIRFNMAVALVRVTGAVHAPEPLIRLFRFLFHDISRLADYSLTRILTCVSSANRAGC